MEIDTTKYDKFIGSYAMKVYDPNSSRIYYTSKVFIMRKQLTASSEMYRNNHLFPISDHKFFIKGDTNEYEFFTNNAGNCNKYVITHGEKKYTFLRMEEKVKDLNEASELLGEYYSDEMKTSYVLKIKNEKLTFEHPVNPDVHIYKIGDGEAGYYGDTWWFKDVIFIRNRNCEIIGIKIQTFGNLSTNIRLNKVSVKEMN